MDDGRTTGILTGVATGATLAVLHGGLAPPGPWSASLAAAVLLAWLLSRRRSDPVARPAPAQFGPHGPAPAMARRHRAPGGRGPWVLLRESTGSGRDPALDRDSSNGGSPGGPAAPDDAESEDRPARTPASAAERRDAIADELDRLADGLEDENSSGEEISFLPPYASDEASDKAESDGQRGDAWDPLLEAAGGDREGSAGSDGKMPVPRHFALGTVAVIRRLLEPDEVERILAEQRRYPRLRFGDVAVQLGLLTETQLQELLLAQQEGLFSEAEIREARNRLRSFQRGGSARTR